MDSEFDIRTDANHLIDVYEKTFMYAKPHYNRTDVELLTNCIRRLLGLIGGTQ